MDAETHESSRILKANRVPWVAVNRDPAPICNRKSLAFRTHLSSIP